MTKNHFIQTDRETLRAMTAKRCTHCQGRVRLHRPSKYLNPQWRCDNCGRTEEVILDAEESVKVLEFK